MDNAWTPERVLALAPDASSAKSGRDLASLRRWQNLGHSESAVWGECQGSGAKPYQTQIDLSEPAFKCSCPSRKFPCKHGLALFLLFAQDTSSLANTQPPGWVEEWLAARAQRVQKKQEKAAAPDKPPDPLAQARRIADRQAKVTEGLEQLAVFLQDAMSRGLIAVQSDGTAAWDQMAARMVDAQAPGIARLLRNVAGAMHSGDGWQNRTLHQLARLQLILEAHGRLGDLPAELAADVQSMIGWTQATEDLLSREGVAGRWIVAAQRVSVEDRLRVQHTWLLSEPAARPALLLQFAHGQQPFAETVLPGTAFDGELVFYPSASPLRAIIKQRTGDVEPIAHIPGDTSITEVLAAHAESLASNPFIERSPFALRNAMVLRDAGRWFIGDSSSRALPVAPQFARAWELLAFSGGRPFDLFAEWDGEFLHPQAAASGDEYALLAGGDAA